MTLEEAKKLVMVILSDRKNYSKSLNYAVGYCQYFMTIDNEEEARVQALYILNNLSSWRHERAKEVRDGLKKFAKLKTKKRR